jgi:hypothetical protein
MKQTTLAARIGVNVEVTMLNLMLLVVSIWRFLDGK